MLEGTRSYPPATLAGQAVFAAGSRLYAVDVATGKTVWTSERYSFSGATTTNGSTVAVPDTTGVSAFDPDGSERWRVEPEGDRHRILATASEGDTLYLSVSVSGSEIPSSEEYDRVHALDWETGEQQWAVPVGDPNGSTPAKDLLAAKGYLYAAVTGGYTVALSTATGETRWEHDTGFGASRLAIAGNTLVRFADDAIGLASDTGAVRWRQPLDGGLAGGRYIYGRVDDVLVALDPKRGIPIWRTRLPESGEPSGISILDSTLYASIGDELYALDEATGCHLGSVTAGDALAVTDNRLVTTDFSRGGVRAFSRP
jgi:outer membrane protein assembly factor BamB